LEKETLLWRGDHFKLQVGTNRYPQDSTIMMLWRGDHFKLQVGINRYPQDSTIMMLGTIFLAILMGELHIVKDVGM
jgi:hypothetical protein